MSQNQKNNLIWLGTIVNTHGIKGEVRILSNTNEPELRFKKGNQLFFYKDKNLNSLTINSKRFHKQFILLTFNNINNINEIEWIKGTKIYCEKNKNDDLYMIDIIGFNVIDQNNNIIGVVDSYINQGPYYNINIKLNNGKITNIPDVDEFIKELDQIEKKLRVNIPNELLEE